MNDRALKCLSKSRWNITNSAQLTRLFPCQYKDFTEPCIVLSKQIIGKDVALEGSFDPHSFHVVIKNKISKDKCEYGVHFSNDLNEFAHIVDLEKKKEQSYSYKDFQNRIFFPDNTVNTVMYYQAVFYVGQERVHVTWFDLKLVKEAEENRWLKKVWILTKVFFAKNCYYATPTGICIYPEDLKIQTEYPSVRGISDQILRELVDRAVEGCEDDFLPEQIKNRYHLLPEREAVFEIHHPSTMQQLKRAQNRLLFDDILYFCCDLRRDFYRPAANFEKSTLSDATKSEFSSSLTDEQKMVIHNFSERMQKGSLNAILDGPEVSEKIPIITSMAMICCENSYQAAISTITVRVAKYLYEKTRPYFDRRGIVAALYTPYLNTSEQKKIKKGVEDGSIQLLFGRQDILQMNFPALSLIIFDNEQIPGIVKVPQVRNWVRKGVHVLGLSSCSVPDDVRKMFCRDNNIDWMTLHGKQVDHASKTIFTDSWKESMKEIQNTVLGGGQAYIICPDENLICNSHTDIETVDDVFEHYCPYFVKLTVINKHMKRKAVTDILGAFINHDVDILICTSDHLDELPQSADVIVIQNAELWPSFLLMTVKAMAQTLILQTNVKNGQIREFCKIKSTYDIISYDASHKAPSDLIGIGMAYYNQLKYITQSIQNPELFEAIMKIAGQMKNLHQLDDFEEGYERENGIQD